MVELGNQKKSKVMRKEEVELRVCSYCDAPLPFSPKKISYFNISDVLCDDCYVIKNIKQRKKK